MRSVTSVSFFCFGRDSCDAADGDTGDVEIELGEKAVPETESDIDTDVRVGTDTTSRVETTVVVVVVGVDVVLDGVSLSQREMFVSSFSGRSGRCLLVVDFFVSSTVTISGPSEDSRSFFLKSLLMDKVTGSTYFLLVARYFCLISVEYNHTVVGTPTRRAKITIFRMGRFGRF